MKHIFKAKQDYENLSVFITERLGFLSKSVIKKQISLGEVRVNGVKVLSDASIKNGDELKIFLPESLDTAAHTVEFVYRDENLAVAVKPVLCETETHLLDIVKKTYPSAVPVHRLDRNTAGLVMFALNKTAEKELIRLIRLKKIDKYYIARLCGTIEPKESTVTVYLKKDKARSFSEVSSIPKNGFLPATLFYRETGIKDGDSILDIKLITGRMHQIRATFAHLGYPVAGDGKYGSEKQNRMRGLAFQALTAYKIRFNLKDEHKSPLYYLDNCEIIMNL